MNKKWSPQVNELVVLNHEPDAVVYRVVRREVFSVWIIDASIEDADPQWIDISLTMPLTIGQFQRFTEQE